MEKGIYRKIAKISGKQIITDSKNPHFGNKYASLGAIIDTLSKGLEIHGLLIISKIEENFVRTSIIDVETAESVDSVFPINSNLDPQKIGSAITYAKRYNIAALLNLNVEADDDANNASEAENEHKKDNAKFTKSSVTQSTNGVEYKISQNTVIKFGPYSKMKLGDLANSAEFYDWVCDQVNVAKGNSLNYYSAVKSFIDSSK